MTPATTPINLVAVDDVPENLIALEALLAGHGVNLLKAASGPEALELLLVHPVALVLLDVQMPGMNGFDLAELMRGSPRTKDIPIIFLTAEPRDPGRAFRGYESGAVDFLYKPIDPHVLRSKVEVFLQLHRQREELAARVVDLQQTLRLNELFVGVLGHDLRTPLAAVVSGAELIHRQTAEERTRTVAERVQRSGMRMVRLIDQLLDFTRARRGDRLPLQRQRIDLAELCRQCLQECEPLARGRALEVEPLGDLMGVWDPDRLLQVLTNLLANALRHGSPDSPVCITLDGRQADTVRVAIQNGGVIPADLLPTIFEPFRSSPTGGRAGQGLGLGLYIVRSMVEAHGGTVTARSSVALATTFEVVLPREAREP